ncbi:YhdP family protein [Marilutibacter aestuarii]|uniref:TIGR02099 family protein n=2 Tax=Marilutibacter aestuarii TaxID=1706195 RepID=A0A508A410_9GAMM|nr:TIGR02099 family protein [Lysobacter aestuarii]
MPTPMRRRFRLARRGLGYVVAVSLVLVAVLLGVASQVLPLAERHPGKVAAWLSERAGRPVAFDRVETAWTRRGPLLKLDNLRIGEPGQAFEVGDAEMLVSVYAGLLPGEALSELRLRGLELALERTDDGRWHVRGLPGQQRSAEEMFETLESLGELQVIDGKLALHAPGLGIDARIPRVDLRLQVSGETVRAAVRAWPRLADAPLDAALELKRHSGNGRAYAGAREADLAGWSPVLRLLGVAVGGGTGRAEAWATLEGSRITAVRIETALDGVRLQPASAANDASGGVAFDHVEGRARWRVDDTGWRLDVPRLQVHGEAGMQALDGLAIAGGREFGLSAERIDAGPLVQVALMSDRLAPAARDWMRDARPRMTLREVRIGGQAGGRVRASAQVDGFGFAPVGGSPGIDGLGGQLVGDEKGFVFTPDTHAPMRLEWPVAFNTTHVAKLDGRVVGWRDGAGWRVGTPGLRIDGGSFGADLRGGLAWQGDGSRPRIDLAADIDEAQLTTAKGFWVRHRMPEAAVAWLDQGLEGGVVRDGRAIVSGDLDDWPFTGNDGRFEARGRIEDGTIRFQPDWPVVEDLAGEVAFVGDGFQVKGSGRLAGVEIDRIEAGIDRYHGGRLAVDAQGGGDARQLLELLRESPLMESIGDTLAHVDASGPARVGFGLRLPLQKDRQLDIQGTVDLANARLSGDRWDLDFDQVRGRAGFSRRGFTADALSVRHQGQAGTLGLRAGDGHVRDPGNVFEATLSSRLQARELLDRAPDMAWLRPHVAGSSPWRIGVSVPKGGSAGGPAAQLTLSSELVGTRFDLPEPMHKPAGESLATTVSTPLPFGSGDLQVAFGNVAALRARSTQGRTGVRVALGTDTVEEAPPEHGLIATGHAQRLDAVDWIAFGRGDREAGLALRGIDITAGQLQLLGGRFPDTRVKVVASPEGRLQVAVEGDALQGELGIPRESAAPITGRFAHVHWRPLAGTVPSDGGSVPAVEDGTGDARAVVPVDPAATAMNPAAIPPLDFEIEDLRINDASLGRAQFRSRPDAGGMRIERLQTRDRFHELDLTGQWTGQGESARTRMVLDVRSQDFGRLFEGLGLGGRTADGEGHVHFDAGWPGSPAAFKAAAVEGRLSVDARDGQLLEVEPGAGRVLGLLSIAQLPRRLMLDFGDLFSKGFAYNTMAGNVVFEDGQARTEDLLIDGPAASIAITGATNLRTEQFDQRVEVRPKAGNLLAAVGAIAGGPVGAAIGAAANAVLEKPIGQIAGKTYRVTGPWKAPRVEVQTREQGRAAARSAPPTG